MPKSIAETAGFKVGDEVESLGGQALISIADFAWALHRAPDSGALPARVRRDGQTVPLTLALPAGWRMKSDISRRVGTWSMRAMAFGGLTLVDLDDDARATRGLAKDAMAMYVKGLGQYNKHAAAKKAGFLKDDVIVGIDALKSRLSEGELIGTLLKNYKAGESVDVAVLRGTERLTLKLPMQ